MDVMFYEVFQEEEKALKLFLPPNIQAGFTPRTIQECVPKPKPPAELISVRTQSDMPLSWVDKLQGILTRSVGYDHIRAYREKTGTYIFAGHLPHYCSRSVAEHAILLILTLLRKLRSQIGHFDSFNRDGLTGSECFEKNILVIGVGRVGAQIVDMARGLRMNVKGVDIEERDKDLEYVKLSDGMAWADVIVCALPLTGRTRGLLNYEVFKTAKPGAFFINVSRGEIAPTVDLNKLLDEAVLGGAGLDVYENESAVAAALRSGEKGVARGELKHLLKMRGRENVILTPHNAFNTREAVDRKAEQSIESVVLFLEKKTFPYPVPEDGMVELKI